MATAEIVIIGGGCTGTSTALQLARRRAGHVILMERGTVGSGPTARSIGIVRLHYSYDPLIRLAARSLEIFSRFEEEIGGTADFARTGFLLLASAAQMSGVRANVDLQQRLGVRTQILAPEEIPALEPHMNVDGVAGAVYEPDSGFADGYATTAAFAAAARRLGVEIWEQTPAEALVLEGGRVAGVRTAQGTVATPSVLVASGPWTPSLLGPIGVEMPIVSTRQQVVQLEVPERVGRLNIVCEDMAQNFYARPETGSTALAGVLDDEPQEVVSPDGFNPGVDLDFIERVGELWRTRYPAAADARVRGGYASLYDMTPDWQPILGAVEEIPGLSVAAGFSGHGFKLSPALGEVLADLLLGRPAQIDISLFRFARFKTGDLIHGRHAQGILG